MKIISVLAIALTLTACGDTLNPSKIRESAVAEHPGAEVTPLPGRDYSYIVRQPDGSVLYVQYMSATSVAHTSSVMLFGPKP